LRVCAVFLLTGETLSFSSSRRALLVSVPIADLRSEPQPYTLTGEQDLKEETQVLYGELLWADRETENWWHVEAPWQPCFHCTNSWRGYPGWIQKEFVKLAPAGSPERPPEARMEPARARQCVVQEASRFMGDPYMWGGLGPAGVDCSGLVHRAYRSCGLVIPRDARDQKLKAKPVSAAELVPGDLVFLADVKEPRVARHVSIYAGGENLIEAPSTGLPVRRIRFKDKLGRSLKEIAAGDEAAGRVVSFGRFIMTEPGTRRVGEEMVVAERRKP
jgi:cell wall-associated NlpC family hydrolase